MLRPMNTHPATRLAYLDCNATMPIRPAVIQRMGEILAEPGNASSVHGFGRRARKAVEDARAAIAALAGTDPNYVVFTGGATESNNTVIRSYAGQPIIVSAIEHPSVLECAPDAIRAPVLPNGVIDMDALENLLRQHQPALLCVMYVNNETGVIQPVAECVRLARRVSPQTHIHCDAVQAAGRIPIDFSALQVDTLTLSAHKMGGPQGVGALIMAPGTRLTRLLHGGGQEKRQRAGTENVAGIAGFGVAATMAAESLADAARLGVLRDKMEAALLAHEPRLTVHGADAPRVTNTTQISLPGIGAETQLMALDLAGVAVSSGAACSSGTIKPSPVLKAMGVADSRALGALRVSLGWSTTKEDIDQFIAAWKDMHARIRDRIAE